MFLPYQQRFITDPNPMKLFVKSRRVGISFALGFKINEDALIHARTDINLYSRDSELAADLVRYVLPWTRISNLLCDDEIVHAEDIKLRQITYCNGSRVNSWSSAAERGVGKSGVSICDEFQSLPDAQGLFDYLSPSRAWGGSITVVGTMRPGTLFQQFAQDAAGENTAQWSHHHITIDEALDQGLLEKVNMKQRATYFAEWTDREAYKRFLFAGLSRAAIRQEYYTEAAEEHYRVYSEKIVEQCMVPQETLFLPAGRKTGLAYVGVDIGRSHDKFALCVVEVVAGGKAYVRELTVRENIEFEEMKEEIRRAMSLWRPEKLCQDASTIGIMLGEWSVQQYGEAVAFPITISGMAKERLLVHLQAMMSSGMLLVPRSADLKKQFLAVTKTVTPMAQTRFILPTTQAGHCDSVLAIALACYGATGDPSGLLAERLRKPEGQRRPWNRDPSRHPAEED